MGSDRQRLEALEQYVSAQAANLTGFVAGILLWSLWLPLHPVLAGAGIMFLAASVWNFYDYLKAKHQ